MAVSFTQLIPGNPGTSFVVAILYVLGRKYGISIRNEDQLTLFTKGIVRSRKVFFSGVLCEIANSYKKDIIFLSNSDYILRLARSELNKRIRTSKKTLGKSDIDALLALHSYIVFSVDMYQFRGYHDYHFITLSKDGDSYTVFEPKSGNVYRKNPLEIEILLSSVPDGLQDILMGFVV